MFLKNKILEVDVNLHIMSQLSLYQQPGQARLEKGGQ